MPVAPEGRVVGERRRPVATTGASIASTTSGRGIDIVVGVAGSDLPYAYTVPSGTTCAGAIANRPTSVRHAVTDALTTKTTSYCYDDAGRLTSATTSSGGPTYAYGFDANTNRTSGPEGGHAVNARDQLTGTGIAYDANGGLTAGGGLALAYNGISQTTSITQAGNTTAYTYAGGGQDERTGAGPTTAVHGLLGPMTETTAGATTSYIRGPGGGLIAERTPGGDFYYVYDGQGSVIALVDPSGVQRAAYTYDPYGDHATAVGLNGTLPPNPWHWSGSYLDATGLYKMGARYYDPTLGRFSQADPVAGGSCNNYDYACGDPINGRDPSGMAMERNAHLDELCGFGSTYNEKATFSDECTRYRNAVVTGMSDYYVYGELRPVQHDANKAASYFKCPAAVKAVAKFLGIGGAGRAIAGSNAISDGPQTALIGETGVALAGKYSVVAGVGPFVTSGATVIDAACMGYDYALG